MVELIIDERICCSMTVSHNAGDALAQWLHVCRVDDGRCLKIAFLSDLNQVLLHLVS